MLAGSYFCPNIILSKPTLLHHFDQSLQTPVKMKKQNIPGLESHWTSPQPLRAEEFLWDRDSNDFSRFYCRDFIVYLEFLTILNNEHTRYTFTQPLSVQMERLHLLPITTLLYLVIFKIIIFTLRVTEPLTKLQSTTYV